jgi:hypothetical protein
MKKLGVVNRCEGPGVENHSEPEAVAVSVDISKWMNPMSILLLKSVISVIMALMAIFNMLLMFEVFGRSPVRFDAAKLKKIHRINGRLFILLYFFVAFFCLRYIVISKEELSARVTMHGLLALSVILILALKVSFVRIYRQFFGKALVLGPAIGLLALGMVATAGAYYFLLTFF